MAELTDDATDFDTLRAALNNVDFDELDEWFDSGRPRFVDKMAFLFGVKPESEELWYGLSVLNKKLGDLHDFYEETNSSDISPRIKEILKKTVLNYKSIFSIGKLGVQLQAGNQGHLREDVLDPLLGNVTFLRQNRAHIRLNAEEIEDCLEVLEEFEPENDLPEGAALTLVDGVDRLKFLIRNSAFFGQKAILEELVQLQFVASSLPDLDNDHETESGNSKSKTMNFILTISSIVLLPPSFVQGVEWYKETPAFKWVSEQLIPERDLLRIPEKPAPLRITDGSCAIINEEE